MTQNITNKMNEVKIEKVTLSCGATGDKLEKAVRLLSLISGKKVIKKASNKRIPSFNVRPGLEVGCMVTLRKKEAYNLLKRLLGTINNQLKRKQIKENSFSFGIAEYIEIPEMEYQRDIGILGLDVTVVFCRAGKRVLYRKIKKGKWPQKQNVTDMEIIEFMEKNFNTKIK